MNYTIEQVAERAIAGFHLVGPWEQTVPQGFEQLTMWVDSEAIQPNEWIAVYYDNPEKVPAEKLRADVVVSVPEGFSLPENSEGVILTTLPGGEYAVAKTKVVNQDFASAWDDFFVTLHNDGKNRVADKPCFEIYLNDGQSDGHWDIAMYIPVGPNATE